MVVNVMAISHDAVIRLRLRKVARYLGVEWALHGIGTLKLLALRRHLIGGELCRVAILGQSRVVQAQLRALFIVLVTSG